MGGYKCGKDFEAMCPMEMDEKECPECRYPDWREQQQRALELVAQEEAEAAELLKNLAFYNRMRELERAESRAPHWLEKF